jgi:hypothetical protein
MPPGMQMQHDSLQQAAQAAFSPEDWWVLMQEPTAREAFAQLGSTEDVEEFVFSGYDRLRLIREKPPAFEPHCWSSASDPVLKAEFP